VRLFSIYDEELRLVGIWTRICHCNDATGVELSGEWTMSIDAGDTPDANTPTGAENGCRIVPLGWIGFHLERVYPRLIGHLFRYRLGRQLES
jgi:hypothetical protein